MDLLELQSVEALFKHEHDFVDLSHRFSRFYILACGQFRELRWNIIFGRHFSASSRRSGEVGDLLKFFKIKIDEAFGDRDSFKLLAVQRLNNLRLLQLMELLFIQSETHGRRLHLSWHLKRFFLADRGLLFKKALHSLFWLLVALITFSQIFLSRLLFNFALVWTNLTCLSCKDPTPGSAISVRRFVSSLRGLLGCFLLLGYVLIFKNTWRFILDSNLCLSSFEFGNQKLLGLLMLVAIPAVVIKLLYC